MERYRGAMGQSNIPASSLIDLLIFKVFIVYNFYYQTLATQSDIVDTTAFLHTLALASKSCLYIILDAVRYLRQNTYPSKLPL